MSNVGPELLYGHDHTVFPWLEAGMVKDGVVTLLLVFFGENLYVKPRNQNLII